MLVTLAIEIANKDYCLLSQKKLERKVQGYDINEMRINELKKGNDRNNIFSKEKIIKFKKTTFTNKKNLIKDSDVFIITVPPN